MRKPSGGSEEAEQEEAFQEGSAAGAWQQRAAGQPSRKPGAHRPGGGTAAGTRPVCVLHHPVEQGR